jgi:uncharacterized integral membrane protein (TIGR00698 family)
MNTGAALAAQTAAQTWLGVAAWRARMPGIAVAALLAFAAQWIADGLGDPLARSPVLVAMLFGLTIGNLFGCPDALRPGLDFTKRYLLRLAVILIGFRITTRLALDLGFVPVAIAATELIVMLLAVRWIAVRCFKLDRDFALLLAGGTAVCGAAAILSVAGVIKARAQQAAIAVTLITLAGTLALLAYPIAYLNGHLPGLDDDLYGIFVGASIYELAQVYGASFAVSELALNTATLVKLSKVLMLIPLLLAIGWLRQRAASAEGERSRLPIPWFVLAFAAVVLLNSSITLNAAVRNAILQLDLFLFLMTMIALGLDTRLARLREDGLGARLVGASVVALVLSTGVAYALVRQAATPATSAASTLAAAPAVTSVGAPRASDAPDFEVLLRTDGGRLFSAAGCGKCHVPSLAAPEGPVHLFSDLLLHDMGPALDDKIVQGQAQGRDWRTAPLVGLGLRKRYLHDGRATTLRDAVLAHGGEAQIVRERFFGFSDAKRESVYRFLNAL